MKESTVFSIVLYLIGFIMGGVFGWNLYEDTRTTPKKPCCTCGYTVIEKGVHVNNCGDTVKIEKVKFDKQYDHQ